MEAKPCIFLVDHDRAASRQVRGLARMMQTDCRVLPTAEEFLAESLWEQPGCIVTEFRLLGMSGLELQQALASRKSRVPVIYVSANPETSVTVRAMRGGAITVLEKPASEQELWDAVREALSRNSELRRIDAAHHETRCRINSLSSRERHVLNLVVDGKTNKVIARELGVSVRTVEACRHKILSKTQTTAVAELVRLAVEAEHIGVDFR
jgi:FixJ family two-component response regulator